MAYFVKLVCAGRTIKEITLTKSSYGEVETLCGLLANELQPDRIEVRRGQSYYDADIVKIFIY